MKKSKLSAVKNGDNCTVKYELDVNDVVDTKVFDMSNSGAFPQMCPCEMIEENGVRTFNYKLENKMPVPEFLKREINKKQMLTLLYNVLSGLEGFGKNMVSLSYVAKASKYIFVDAESLEVCFIVAAVDKDVTDMSEIKDIIKSIIADAKYFELDKDNYVAKLISFTNKSGTFSTADMKEYVNRLLLDIGIHIEEEKAAKAAAESQAPNKVSRVGVMMNNAKMNSMNQPSQMPQMPQMGRPNGAPQMPQMPQMGGVNGAPQMPQMPQMGGANGALQMPQMPQMGGVNGAPQMPQMPQMGRPNGAPQMPQMPQMGGANGAPQMPQMPQMGGVNGAPQMPQMPQMGRPNGAPQMPQMPQMGGANGAPQMPQMPQMGGANGAPQMGRPNGAPQMPQMPQMGGANGAPQMPQMGRTNGMPPMPSVNSMNDIEDDQKTIVEDMSFMEPVKARVPEEPKTPEKKEEPKAPEMPSMPPMPEMPKAPEMPSMSSMPEMPKAPEMPSVPPMPEMPKAPEMPSMPPMPEMPKAPEMPSMPPMPEMPKAPEMPSVPPMPEMPKAPEMPSMPPMSEMQKAPVNDAPQQMPTPYLLRKKTNERIYLNKEEFTIGKSATKADYTITDNSAVSRIHCIVTRRNGVSYIRDNNSTNGTFVNNEELLNGNERFLTNNATVTLGDEEFTFFIR